MNRNGYLIKMYYSIATAMTPQLSALLMFHTTAIHNKCIMHLIVARRYTYRHIDYAQQMRSKKLLTIVAAISIELPRSKLFLVGSFVAVT